MTDLRPSLLDSFILSEEVQHNLYGLSTAIHEQFTELPHELFQIALESKLRQLLVTYYYPSGAS